MTRDFHVWAAGDSHVGTDIKHGRRSLADAIHQSEFGGETGPAFDWDIMLDVGDLSGNQGSPTDEEGELVREQYGEMKRHSRSQVYNIAGNHDANIPGEPVQWWFRKYGDPLGESTQFSGVDLKARPFAVEGEWDHYSFVAGNVLFLMMSDRNDGGPPVGRSAKGGYPAGAVTRETFDWWTSMVEANADKIIVSVHHHMLKETTVASGEWEGFTSIDRYGKRSGKGGYHGYFADGGPMGASYLYWVDGNPDAQAFERYLAERPGAIDLWIGGHTHTFPDDVVNGRSHIERKWDATFLNCCAMTKYHVNGPNRGVPMSRLLTFTEGSDQLRIQCYLHTSDYAPQGFYAKAERTVKLRRRFEGL